jgi:mono/diheme cytochrome c family protein
MGSFEWARESIRKPFIIYDFLYANSQLKDQSYADMQYITQMTFSSGDRGKDLYLHNCRSCHAMSGYNELASRLSGVEEEHIANILTRFDYYITGKMPPFVGDEDDVVALAAFLKRHAARDPLKLHPDMPRARKQEIVFRRRCGGCHTMAGLRPITATFEGISAEEASDILDILPDLAVGMPAFTGDDNERQLLIEFLTGAGK